MNQLLAAIEVASILCLVTVATMCTFRLAGFPDLSVDGVFTLGAVVLARCHIAGIGWYGGLIAAVVAGAAAGLITATLAGRLRINPLLASVLVLTLLYTVNLRILGRATQPLFELSTQFVNNPVFVMIIAAIVTGITLAVLRSEFGCAIRSTGVSSQFLTQVGRPVSLYRVALVMVAGSLVSLAGGLMAVRYGFADVSMGVGVVIIGIASLIIGEQLLGRHPFVRQVLAAPLGVLVYQCVFGIALSIGLQPVDMKLATGVLAIALLAFQRLRGDELITPVEEHL